jgi:hypothetical protein
VACADDNCERAETTLKYSYEVVTSGLSPLGKHTVGLPPTSFSYCGGHRAGSGKEASLPPEAEVSVRDQLEKSVTELKARAGEITEDE